MTVRTRAQRNLVGLVIAVAAAICIAGGMALTAFANPQSTDGQDLAAASTELTAQDTGDAVLYWHHTEAGGVATLHKDGSCDNYSKNNYNSFT